MADSFYIVAVGIAHKRPVVVGVIFRPQARFVKHLGMQPDRGIEELTYSCTTRRNKSDVTLPKPFAGLAWTNPELRFRIGTETDDLSEVHDAPSTERGENTVIEGSTPSDVCTLDR